MVSTSEIAIIDIGIGNISSVRNAIYHIGYDPIVVSNPDMLINYEHIILPGVGHFGAAAKKLSSSGFYDAIVDHVYKEKPLLGICLGMQLLFTDSEEAAGTKGLGFIDGSIISFPESDHYPTPHVGWNNLTIKNKESNLFYNIKNDIDFYFVHSFHAVTDTEYILASSNYGLEFPAIVQKNNVYGIQFHPEKSQSNGLQLLENFCGIS